LDSTASLLERIRRGDTTARDRLVRRYLPALKRWARGRLPARARDLSDTDDLVQITLLRALDQVEGFEYRREGALVAYMRRILINALRDEIRRANRRPTMQGLGNGIRDAGPSPLEAMVGRERLERYEQALAKLPPRQQEAVILRLELGFSHAEVAGALDFPSANAARMAVSRALVRLSEVMHGD
jgi:RNA polymerase sigma-70 factor (ECF subfamily)